jgi:hypothetical protein
MATLRAHGIEAALPSGFEGRIFRRDAVGDEQPYPVVHLATFPLPSRVSDFGGGAVELMGPADVFVVLFEYGPESVGQALFSRQGMPLNLSPGDFRPYVLRRGIGGQAGSQWFFTEASRPFTLYAVLGSYASRFDLAPRVNDVLNGLAIASTPMAAGTGRP